MKTSNNGFLRFLRRNALYFVLALCIMAIALSVTLVLINDDSDKQLNNGGTTVVTPPNDDKPSSNPTEPEDPVVNPDPVPDNPTPSEPVIQETTYVLPVKDASKIGEYSELPVFNAALKRYSAHLAVDFFAPEGTAVYAVADGTVESVETTLIYGTTVVINHGDGLKSVYNSLADGDCVIVGQNVSQGTKIGEVSLSNRQEYKEGAHLHFEMKEDDKNVDPAKYLTFINK